MGIRSDTVDYLHAEMQGTFPEAEVTGYHTAMHSMTCDPKDRHVLAAAVRSDAAAIVTFNMADFPAPSVNPHNIDVIHPADFLLDLLDLAPSIVITELNSQATANRLVADEVTIDQLRRRVDGADQPSAASAPTEAGQAGPAHEHRHRVMPHRDPITQPQFRMDPQGAVGTA